VKVVAAPSRNPIPFGGSRIATSRSVRSNTLEPPSEPSRHVRRLPTLGGFEIWEPDKLRERAVRMVAEVRPQYPSQWAAITAVAGMLGIGTPETLRTWIRRSEVDSGQRPGVTTQMAEENKALRKEIAELRRANEILKAAAIFFGAELDRPGRR